MGVVNEKKNGLICIFTLRCKMCNIEHFIKTDYEDRNDNVRMDVNAASVLAHISTGMGYSNMEQIHAALDIPTMSYRKYDKYHSKMATLLQNTAWTEMEKAGQEEAKIAKEIGSVDRNGVPLITVIADGAWCKRSYNVNYNASSGVVIHPYYDKYVLYPKANIKRR